MLQRRIITFSLFILSFLSLKAQVGGEGTYQFLNLPISARTSALGGKLASIDESDLSTTFNNPSLLDSNMHNNLFLSYIRYYAGINYASFSYARSYNKIGNFAIGIQQVGYGSFTRADAAGTIQGTFTANEMAFNLMYSRQIDSCFRVGVNLKPIYSHLDSYKSWGFATDIAANYNSTNGLFSAGITLKNIGLMVKPYTDGTRENIPFEIIAGFSKKLAHAPFRFVVTLHQLQNWNLYYNSTLNSSNSDLGGTDYSSPSKIEKIGKEFISHVILGAEFVPVRNFYFRVGYNYQRRNELKIQEKVSTVGFSWGLGIKISKFNISYSRATYHLAGSTNHFAITTDLDNFFKKKNTPPNNL